MKNRYFILLDKDSDQFGELLQWIAELAGSYTMSVKCRSKSGLEKTIELWELTVKQVQDLGAERVTKGYHYTIYRLLAGEDVAKVYVSYLQKDARRRG